MLVSRFFHCFSRNARLRGEAYFQDGLVKGVRHLPGAVRAMVQGQSLYEIGLDWKPDSEKVNVICSCPHFQDGNFCKHVWATLLAVESQPDLHTFPKTQKKLFLVHSRAGDVPPEKQERNRFVAWREQIEQISQDSLASYYPFLRGGDKAQKRDWEVWYRLDLSQPFQEAPEIRFHMRSLNADGRPGSLEPLSLSEDKIRTLGEEERDLLSLLVGSHPSEEYSMISRPATSYTGCRLSSLRQEEVLSKLSETGRLGWSNQPNGQIREVRRLEWDGGLPWEMELHFEEAVGKGWKLRGFLSRKGEEAEVERAVAFIKTGLVVVDGVLSKFANPETIPWIQQLRRPDGLFIQSKELDAFVALLANMEVLPKIKYPKSFPWKFNSENPTPRIRFFSRTHGGHSNPQIEGELSFVYGKPDAREEKVLFLRELAFEKESLDKLISFNIKTFSSYADKNTHFRIPPQRLAQLVREFLRLGWEVESERLNVRSLHEIKIEVSSGIDWFDLKLTEKNGKSPISTPELLKALKHGDAFVQLGDGTQGILPEDWLERFGQIANLGKLEGGKLRFRASQAVLLNTLLDAQSDNVSRDKTFTKLVSQINDHEKILAKKEPAAFKGKLRNYQRKGLGWMKYLEAMNLNGCLADDMGLGKTVQLLAHLQSSKGDTPSLIVAPKSLVFNWISEAAKFTPTLKVLEYTGGNRKVAFAKFGDVDLVVTTYGAVRSDINELAKFGFHYIVLDESQTIKNSSSLISHAVRQLKCKHRLVLTGTPIENHIGELWSQFEFLNPGMLGPESGFKRFSQGAESQKALKALSTALQPFILRRTKEQVLKELPPKTEQVLYCDFEESDQKKYDELREHFRQTLTTQVGKEGIGASQIQILEAMLRLRQAACDFRLLDNDLPQGEAGPKIKILLAQIEEIVSSGHKALIFSQFTSFLGLVRRHLDHARMKYEYLDGTTTNRKERVERFQEDKNCPLFLLSLKAGGVGLNLTAADYVFVLDPWWNPAAEAQAIDRAHRIGQKHPVMVYRMIVRGTIEEKVLELQNSKKELTETVLGNEKSILRTLTTSDLEQLFGSAP